MDKTVDADAAKLAGLQIDLLSKFRAGHLTDPQIEWFLGLSRQERDRLCGIVSPDLRFRLVDEFPLVVPADYNHATQLASFFKKLQGRLDFDHERVSDAKFAGATTRLIAGQRLTVKIFKIHEAVSSEECLAHLRSQKALLVSAQGLSIVYEDKVSRKSLIRVSKTTHAECAVFVSLDEEKALWIAADNKHYAPYLRFSYLDGYSPEFTSGPQERNWQPSCFLLCFCDVSAETAKEPDMQAVKEEKVAVSADAPVEAIKTLPPAKASTKTVPVDEKTCPACHRLLDSVTAEATSVPGEPLTEVEAVECSGVAAARMQVSGY